MRISDWSSDVCSSDLCHGRSPLERLWKAGRLFAQPVPPLSAHADFLRLIGTMLLLPFPCSATDSSRSIGRSEEHTSELQSLMRISYAVFCLKKKNRTHMHDQYTIRIYI